MSCGYVSTLRSLISLSFASRSFFSFSTSDGSVFAASSGLGSSFSGKASEYHLNAVRELNGVMVCGRRSGDAVRRDVKDLAESLMLTDLEARRRGRWIMTDMRRVWKWLADDWYLEMQVVELCSSQSFCLGRISSPK